MRARQQRYRLRRRCQSESRCMEVGSTIFSLKFLDGLGKRNYNARGRETHIRIALKIRPAGTSEKKVQPRHLTALTSRFKVTLQAK